MDVGFHDMAKVVRQVQEYSATEDPPFTKDEPFEIDVTVFAQYGMGADTFARLRHNVEEIYNALLSSGHIPSEEQSGEEAK